MVAMEKGTYVLSGSLPVNDDLEAEQIERVRRHLSGFASVYLAHDETAHTVSLHISGTMPGSSGGASKSSPRRTVALAPSCWPNGTA
jgi:hypothetical protein